MDRPRDCVIKQLDDIRLKLLDLTNRNRLLNFKYRSGCIRIVDEDPGHVFDYLVKQGKQMTFLALPEDAESPDGDGEEMQLFTGTDDSPAIDPNEDLPSPQYANGEGPEKHRDDGLPTRLEADLLETRLRRIRSDGVSFIQETGNNHLFLALGFLRWKERADAAESHEAPLILVPVEIDKGTLSRTAQRRVYKIRCTGEDLVPNRSLREKLRRDHDLILPMFNEGDTVAATGEEELDPDAYFDIIAKAIAEMRAWEVRREMVVAFFTFAKLQMYLDLDPKAWPNSCIGDNDLIQRLLGCKEHAPEATAQIEADETHEADSLPLVLDADSSQTRAIRRALSKQGTGNRPSIVIQGPPGTGKSQTITNLIACLLAEGKSVLFVAEKMAALDVVHRNMEKVGLASFCLELHSHKVDKKRVINSLKATCEERDRLKKTEVVGSGRDLDRLRKVRDSLAEYIELLKKPVGPADETVFDVFGKAEMLRQTLTEIVPLQIENIDAITSEQIESAKDRIQNLARLICEIGLPGDAPWHGYEPVDLFGGDEGRVAKDLQTIRTTTAKIRDEAHRLFEETQTSVCAAELTYRQTQAMCTLDSKRVPENLLTDIAGAVLTDRDQREWDDIESWRLRIHDYRRMIQESSQFLKQGNGLSSTDLERLSQTAEQVRSYGLGPLDLLTAQELRDTSERLKSLLDQFQKLAEVPVFTGIPKPRTMTEIAGFARLESLVRRRPQGIEAAAYERLLTPSLRVVFTRMMEEGQRLTRTREALARTFVLTDVCLPDELAAVRRVLRGTRGWLQKALSSEYRQGKRTLRSFMRQPSQASCPGMPERLEALEKFLTEEATFSCCRQYTETFGEFFRGLETDWEGITNIVTWVTDICDACDSAALAKAMVDLEIDGQEGWPAEGQLLQVIRQVETELHRYADIVSGLSGADAVTPIEGESIEMLRGRLDKLASAVTTLESALASRTFDKNATLTDILKAVESQLKAQALRATIEMDVSFKSLAGSHFNGVDTDIDAIVDTINWALNIKSGGLPLGLLTKLCEGMPHDLIAVVRQHAQTWDKDLRAIKVNFEGLTQFGPLDVTKFLRNSLAATSLGDLEARIDRAFSAIGHLTQWAGYCRLTRRARDAGLGVVVQLMEAGTLEPTKAADTYLYTVYDGVARKVLREHPELATFTTIEYESRRRAFAELDAQLLQRHRKDVGHKASLRAVPSGTRGTKVSDLSDMHLLRNEFHKERRHLPIRQLMSRAGGAIRALTPIFMMSPLSVAQFLEQGKHTFDVVVMDEASQIQPPDALGAIARAKQMIVVGDSKQLPPTNFFDRTMDNPDDDQEETIFNDFDADQSILTKCEQLEFPSESLLWHYRSEHESLIAFSNARWYDNRLIIFPSSGISSTKLGILYHYLEGATYTPGKNVNEVEGKHVAEKIIEHARRSPELSLGVGTLNLKQRILIEDMLARLIREDPSAELSLAKLNAAHDGTEPLFIKNLENLQGDERDIIFISCTFGPDKDGRVYQRFGPLAYENGWRRLNVLITRAKKRVEVFTSMRPEDITGEPGQEGRVALKEYLKYAETGALPDYGHATIHLPDSDFECAVAQVVRNMGYEVTPQVGVAGYFVDIGVRNPLRPDEYVLGIECDGRQYHSSVHARDRDRLREEVLRRRGWEIHRIWSTDWFKNREPETARLKKKLVELVQKSTPTVVEVAKSEELKSAVVRVSKPGLSDDELRIRITIYCRQNIARPEEAQRADGFLHPIVLDAFVIKRITNRADLQEYIPVDIRVNLNNDDLQYLDDIFEIIEQAT